MASARIGNSAGPDTDTETARRVSLAFQQGESCYEEILSYSKDGRSYWQILDIGPKSIVAFEEALASTKTLVWNGPFGAFELPPFDAATMQIAKTVASLTKDGKLTSVAGGGDTVSALNATERSTSDPPAAESK